MTAARYINPVPQYLDNNGDPVPNGKLYFYESGTNDTLKAIYLDINQDIPSANPVILDAAGRAPNIFYAGSAHVVLTESDETQIWNKDPVSGGSLAGSSFGAWSAVAEYSAGDIAEGSDDSLYRSLQNANIGNDPTFSTAFWEAIEFVRTWNTNVTYSADEIVKASDGNLYKSLQAANTANNPVTAAAWWDQAVYMPLGEDEVALGNVSGATSANIELGSYFTATMTAAATITITNPPASGDVRIIALEIEGGDTFPYSIALSGGTVEWAGGTGAPTPTASDIVTVVISDGVTAKASINQDYA